MENHKYIKVSAIYKKLRQAKEVKIPIYISGAVGFGKTAAVEYFYRKEPHRVFSGKEGYLEEMPNIEDISQKVVIFEDISWLTDLDSQNYVINIIKKRRIYPIDVILIGRGRLPGWLRLTATEEDFLFGDEADLRLSEKEIEKFFESRGVIVTKEELTKARMDTQGHPLALTYLTYYMSETPQDEIKTCRLDRAMQEKVRMDLYHYYDHAFYEKWDIEMREVLLAVCQYPAFTIKMTEMITGNDRIPILFEQALTVGNFLTKCDKDTYCYRKNLRLYFRWKQSLLYTKEMLRSNYEHAALYYEMEGDVVKALKYYKKAGNKNKLSELLIKNARKHPGEAYFFELKEYYFSIPEEIIKESPILISGMSMLYSLMFQPEKSEYWYNHLVLYQKKVQKESFEYHETVARIAYLNIGLPHRGIHGIIKMMKNTAVLCINKQVKMPEFSVTGNTPSIMNGGLDFCEWSRNDKALGILMRKPVEIVLGKYGVGLVNIALAESGMENGSMDSYEIMNLLNSGYMLSDTGGKIELCFAATGLMIKQHMAKGQPKLAERLFTDFEAKATKEKANQLFPNMKTLYMWMQLTQGNLTEPKRWINLAPNDMISFFILDRYQYIHKIRCLIALGRCDEALALSERMNLYFTRYERYYLWMENQILKAIIQYRKKMDIWQETLNHVLKKAQRYHFVRIFSMEGAALKPLLNQIKNIEVSETYLKEIKEETEEIALYYPYYLKEETILENPLTEMESKILKMMCKGKSSKEICNLNSFSYSTFKFHTHNIYQKLKVNSRAEAEREAIRLELD